MSAPRSFTSGKGRKMFLPVSLFFLLLAYFVLGTGWQEPAKLVLRGQTSGSAALIRVRWDSGQGFNGYEQRAFRPESHPLDEQFRSRIILGAAGRCYPASLSKKVVCTAIFVDGKEISLKSLADGQPFFTGGELHFDDQERITFPVRARSHISIRFRTDTQSGVAFVSVNSRTAEPDLYMANVEAQFKQVDYWLLQPDGSFTVETDLPRYPIRELEIRGGGAGVPIRLTAAELHGKGQIRDLLHGRPVPLGSVRFSNALKEMRSFFHPLQFVQQILFALLSAWLLTALIQFGRAAGGLRSSFLAEKRPWFWLMLGVSLAVFGTWLAAFWPGVMSVDSLNIWRAAMLPDMYQNDHPLLNVILYKYLYHLWNHAAAVPVAQVVLTSLLISWCGFWVFRQGVSIHIVLLWLLFVLGSVPVGVYTVVQWKDIPFALLAVFWAVMLVMLRQERRQNRLRWTWQRACALLLLGLALGFVRHNGLVYLAALPLLFLLLRLVPLKKALFSLAVLLAAAGIGFAVLHHTGRTAGTSFLTKELRNYSVSASLSLRKMAKNSLRMTRDYITVLNINQKYQQWDKFHHYFQDRQAWWFLLLSGWWDAYPYQKKAVRFPALNKAALRIYEKSYQEPWVLLTWNPVWLLGLLPVLTLLFCWLPNTAVLGAVLLAGALPLVYLQIFNWRYYYFLYFGLLFLPAFVSLDFARRTKCVSPS